MNKEEQFASIAALDLDPIKVKLMHKVSGEGWSLAYAGAVEFEYRRFLYLVKQFPYEQVAPLFDVDVFWHYHILDTMKYAADCDAVFGYFLHHFPYVGLRGDEDFDAHHRVGARMRELYEHTYGEEYLRLEGTLAAERRNGAADKTPHHGPFLVKPNMAAFSISVPSNMAAFSISVPPNMTAFSITAPPSGDATGVDARARAAERIFYSHRPSLAHMAHL